jgi:hypothetical protein
LRRKVNDLAAQAKALHLMQALARRSLAEQPGQLWTYLDGHVSVYSGQRNLREHHVARLRAAHPSVIDYWVNQPDGDPLLVLTGPEQEGLVRQLPKVIAQLQALAPGRSVTVVFDREGWSPKLFAQIKDAPDVHFLTYRKATAHKTLPRLALDQFHTHEWNDRGCTKTYELADARVRIPYQLDNETKLVELRQITRRKPDGMQTHILTDDFERPAAELAHRMFSRWSQENYFKYAKEHRDLDAMVTNRLEPADRTRLVANPERRTLKTKLASLQANLREAHEEFGRRKLTDVEPVDPHAFGAYAAALQAEIDRMRARIDELPAKVALQQTEHGKDMVQPRAEHRRLMHVFRIAAHRTETALLELLRPNFPDWRHEGRDLVRTILHSSGNLRVTDTHLHIEVLPLASPYKTRALEALCETLSSLGTHFPGTDLTMAFSVLPPRRLS